MTAPEFPKNGSFTYGPRDPETGEAWCYVSRKMAHEHPKGRLGPIEYAIVGYFLIAAGIKLMLIFQYGVPNWSMPLAGLLQILTALGLLWRVPGALVLVIVIALNLYWLIYRTSFGEVVRALANNEELARASGIDPHKVSVRVWFIAGCAGGLAGIFTGVFALVNPLMGWNLILITVMVSIVAGVGSVRGALIASVAAGVLTAFITLVSKPLYAEVILLAAFILVLWSRRRRVA